MLNNRRRDVTYQTVAEPHPELPNQIDSCKCDNAENASVNKITFAQGNLAVLGHEIRNPLSAMCYALQSWPASNDDPQRMDNLLQILRRQVSRLSRLCDDLLDVGRNAQGNLIIRRAAIDVPRSIQYAFEEVQPFAEKCGHTIYVDVGDLPITLLGDESRLTQVFSNLMHNAAKFTDRGGQMHVSLERDSNVAIVRLKDNGRGICADRLRNLFFADQCFQRRSELEGEGLGIGLWLSKSIVELHGGTIEAFSEGLGHGCTIVVRLPVVHTPSSDGNSDVLLDMQSHDVAA